MCVGCQLLNGVVCAREINCDHVQSMHIGAGLARSSTRGVLDIPRLHFWPVLVRINVHPISDAMDGSG